MDTQRELIVRLLQDYAAEAELLVQAFATHSGLHPTDMHAVIAVMRAEAAGEPLSPGRLGARLGISSGATTAVLDRLARVDLVERVRDEHDRRRSTLRVGAAAGSLGATFFGPLGAGLDAVLAGLSEPERATVVRFLDGIITVVRTYRSEVGRRATR